jgi:hypothetical protein
MIFLVDRDGNIAVASLAFIQTCNDRNLALLILSQDWCVSMAQASELARDRRRRRRAPF